MVLGDLNISAVPLGKVAENLIKTHSSQEMIDLLNKEYKMALNVLSGEALGTEEKAFEVRDLVRKDLIPE